jgi:transcriptional regulator with XRE-family HTH domain
MRGLSQRALGDLMGLGKEKGSSRINRYEHQVTAIGFDNLAQLAKALNVPAAYLLAETPGMADAILALTEMSEEERVTFARRVAHRE